MDQTLGKAVAMPIDNKTYSIYVGHLIDRVVSTLPAAVDYMYKAQISAFKQLPPKDALAALDAAIKTLQKILIAKHYELPYDIPLWLVALYLSDINEVVESWYSDLLKSTPLVIGPVKQPAPARPRMSEPGMGGIITDTVRTV